ncbi:HlyD family efflux transporter periplasmic adaptor subunit [Burkholderia sp. Bp9012]|uniref:HlyD family efflux transporter periplasmic adaptor subunit n=1 Tax=Burkholderia sp. Bp9012 TaxID=2184562 RepID=UPI001628B596|nr:HlyD family efflux transporter periplasmic adaptor subunit [Burkholderia sp. Bp9012]
MHYTQREHLQGVLVPSTGLVGMTSASDGVVSKVLVSEGEVVHAGQPIAEVSRQQSSREVGDTQAAIAADLALKQERLTDDLKTQQASGAVQRRELLDRMSLLRAQIAQMDQQVALQKQRADSAMSLYEQWSSLGGNGVISRLQLLQQHDSALQNQVELKQLSGEAYQLRDQLAQIQGQLTQLPSAESGKRNDTERALADVSQAISQNALNGVVVLRAPVDGTVATLFAHVGQAVSKQGTLLNIVPKGAALIAELKVPSQAIGFLREGEPVVVRYASFPYPRFGSYGGRVIEVSHSAVEPDSSRSSAGASITSPDPEYRVRVALDRQTVVAYGRIEALRPGMALEADVLVARRHLRDWLWSSSPDVSPSAVAEVR